MLKMILADDESIVRDGLKTIIPWTELNIEIIAEAIDGQEAYDLCNQLNPDILLTDIRMPIMDGLEVAIKLKEAERNIKIIIISGIQDFNYVKTALNINAAGYILKPIKIDELKNVVSKVTTTIYDERNNEEKMRKLKLQLQENIHFAREKFLYNLVSGKYSNEKEIQDKFSYFGIPFNENNSSMVAVAKIDNPIDDRWTSTEQDKHLLVFGISNIIDEILNTYNCGLSFYINDSEFVIILNQHSKLDLSYFQICEEIRFNVNKFFDISISMGLGCSVDKLSTLSSSYNDSLIALGYRFYTGNNSILSIDDIYSNSSTTNERLKYSNLYKIENDLMNFIKLGDTYNVDTIIKTIFEHFLSTQNLPVKYIQNICIEMISIAFRSSNELDEEVESLISNRGDIVDTIYSTQNIFDLQNYILAIFNRLSEYFASKYDQKNTKIVSSIKNIINKRYNENISVSQIAKEVYMTPNYLSLIFKKETGENISEYITKTRTEAAKDLLKTTDFKIYEIAEMTGFNNSTYFSTVFKKYTGLHPQQYRLFSDI